MSFFIPVKRKSDWVFDTFGGATASMVVSGTFGWIKLTDPKGEKVTLTYGGLGGGYGAGIKIPKMARAKLKLPDKVPDELKHSLTVGPFDFPSWGSVYATEECPGKDLTLRDLRGVCVFVEFFAGAVGGGSILGMIAGLQGTTTWWRHAISIACPIAGLKFYLNSARAVIDFGGMNAGIQAGMGLTGYVGVMW